LNTVIEGKAVVPKFPESLDSEIDDKEMSLVDHLVELRNRLIYSILALIAAFIVCFCFSSEIYSFLAAPLSKVLLEHGANRRMIFTDLTEPFFTQVKVTFFAAACLAFPVVASQLWLFIAPGLYRHEKRAFLPFLIATPVLFLLGASMVYYVVFPLAWRFFISFETQGSYNVLPIQLEAKVSEYLNLSMQLIFAFGLVFQLPVALTLMTRVGLISSAALVRWRRRAIVLVFIAAAILTPPDVISQLSLALPMLVLYEISIIAARVVERNLNADNNSSY
jgi:sec-independent protein translocase protein TatC